MRLPRVRFKLRWLMVAVAVLAAAAGAVEVSRRSTRFRQRSYTHMMRALTEWCTSSGPRETAWRERLRVHDLAMQAKYERAALSPWHYVEPDPPEPR
jgi:hypothetical protein